MKIRRFVPEPPPPPKPTVSFSMTFTRDEAWVLVMALQDAYEKHKHASDRELWRLWAEDLDRELRRDD